MTVPEYMLFVLTMTGIGMILLRCSVGWKEARKRKQRSRLYEYGASKTIGSREVQEDEYGIVESEEGIMAVLADGMGKHFGGKIASRTVVEVFQDIFEDRNAFFNPQYYFRKAFQGANREILKRMDQEQGRASAAAVILKDGKLYYAAVGNVKVAVYRNRELVPLTAGHTIDILAKQKYMEGKLSREEATALLEHHRLYNFVGQDGFCDIEFFDIPVQLREEDYILLMTDGMYEGSSWKAIEECLEAAGKCQKKHLL
ncbi:MAG: SpoIIE family protein phosphatase [Clostridiales bacterium]|nr:SpoIIE family protein phosphatase [Clostridiales bacterium]